MIDDNWFKKRKYLHFDSPISFDKANKIVSEPSCISKWNFFPFLRMTIKSKKIINKNGEKEKKEKIRDISYASHIDSHIYSYYSKILSEKYEKIINSYNLNKNIICFRKIPDTNNKGQCNIHFAKKAFSDISSMAPCDVLCFDIKGFFDNLDHIILKKMWNHILGTERLPKDHFQIFKSLTNYSYVDRDCILKRFSIPRNGHSKLHRICSINDFRNIVRKENFIKNIMKV